MGMFYARVSEPVDDQHLKCCEVSPRAGSSPAPGTGFLKQYEKTSFYSP